MVTPKDITEYSDLTAEIKEMEKEIARKEHEVLTDVVSGSSPDDPYTQHSISVHGVSGADRLRSRLKRRVAELDERRAEIEAFVDGLPRSSQRRIVRMRMEGLSWGEITARMGYRYSIDKVKKIYAKIFKIGTNGTFGTNGTIK